MNHIGTLSIETERLLLRRFCIKDAPAMYQNWACDPDNLKYLTWANHQNCQQTEQTILNWVSQYENPDYYKWAITLKTKSDEVIGDISVTQIDPTIESVTMGYVLSKNYWGNGYMSEALKAVIRYLFEQVEVRRILARHAVDNIASGRVMQKAGILYEGITRQSAKNNQGIVDTANYGVLRTDLTWR